MATSDRIRQVTQSEKRIKSPRLTSEEQQHDLTHPRGTFHQDRLDPFAIMGNTIPPRDPDEDEEDENEEEDHEDEPLVVREPDED